MFDEFSSLAASGMKFALAATLGLVATGGTLYAFQRSIIYPVGQIPTRAVEAAPANGVFQTVLKTADGETLKAYWKAPRAGAPVAISFHGNAATPQPYSERFASGPWAKDGYGVLAIAYRGYPGSTGSPSEDGLIADAEAAYAFVKANAPNSPLLIHGHSLGSAVAVALSERHPSFALYLEAPFTTLDDVATSAWPFLPDGVLLDHYRSVDRIKRSKAGEVVIVHGDADGVVPHALGKRLAEARPGTPFLTVPGGDHYRIGLRDAEVHAWLVKVLAKAKPAQ